MIKRINREFVKKLNVLEYYEDTMLTDDGREAKWDMLHHIGAAAVVAVREDGKILMVRQYRNSVERMTLEIPAGKRDAEDEATETTAARELEEETGYRAGKLTKLVGLITAIAYCDEFIDIYVAEDLIGTAQHLDEDEEIDVAAYTLEELQAMIFSGQIRDAKTVASIMAYSVWKQNRENR